MSNQTSTNPKIASIQVWFMRHTPYAATQVVNVLLEKLEKVDIEKSELFVRGIGSGRDSAVRALSGVRDLNIVAIKDITPLPHNGCRPSKPKRN